jgi:hypothetical protein
MDLAIASVAAVALAVGGLRAADGHIGVGSLLIILLLGNGVFHPVRELGKLYHQYLISLQYLYPGEHLARQAGRDRRRDRGGGAGGGIAPSPVVVPLVGEADLGLRSIQLFRW